MSEQKDPFEFYDSPWWKDMNKQLCTDGWPAVVVPLNCMVRDAKKAYDDLKQNAVPMDVAEGLAEALRLWIEIPERDPYLQDHIRFLVRISSQALKNFKNRAQ